MKVWTQSEYDEAARGVRGVLLGTGDFRGIDFRGRHAVVIGGQSILGENANLGMHCEIGDYCEIGRGLTLGAHSRIGENCHIGERAMIGEGCRIGRMTSLATGCGIAPGVELGEGVHLPYRCLYLFDYTARNADGRTLAKCVPSYGENIYAFIAGEEDRRSVYVYAKGRLQTLDRYEDNAADTACCTGMTGTHAMIAEGRRMLATAKYFRALYRAEGLCAERRKQA